MRARRAWHVWGPGVAGLLILGAVVWAGNPDTGNPIPEQNANFMPDLQRFLREEDALRYKEILGGGMVSSGGYHGTVPGLVGTPSPLIAYPGGGRIVEQGSIAYPDNAQCWVIATRTFAGNPGSFTRVANTHYAIDCISSTLTLPPDSVELMRVTTSAGAIVAVTDVRPTFPFSSLNVGRPLVAGTLCFYSATSSLPVCLQAGNTTVAQTYTWPPVPPGGDGYLLSSTALGQWSWVPAATFTAPVSPLRFIQQGTCAVAKVISGLMERSAVMTKVWVWSDTAPTGADLIVDIRVNDISIWTTTPANRVRVLVGAQAGEQTAIDNPNVAAGDRVGVWVDQVGSTTPGCNDLLVTVQFTG